MMDIPYYERAAYREGNPFSLYKNRIDTVLTSLAEMNTINDIIELSNIVKYIENIDEKDGLSKQEIEYYHNHLSNIKCIIGTYFSQITPDNFKSYIDDMSVQYVVDFWSIMCSLKKHSTITQDKFKEYLDKNPHHVDDILTQKDLAIHFSQSIYQHLLSYPNNIHYIISHLFERKDKPTPPLFIRQAFSSEQLRILYKTYIESEAHNINILRLLRVSQNNIALGLDDEIRLLAKRKEQRLAEELSKSQTALHMDYRLGVSFRDCDEICQYTQEDGSPMAIYDRRWIHENLDYPTLLNNFIYLFGYTDLHFRSAFPIQPNHISGLVRLFSVRGINTYKEGGSFDMICGLFSMQMMGYITELKKDNIDIENIFKWFFEEYLDKEFSVSGFHYNTPSEGTSYLEKCKNIASEIERVLKEYRLYSQYGNIDPDLFEMSSEHLVFSELKSMQRRKYIYPQSEQIYCCMHDMFNNSMLCVTDDKSLKEYECIYDAMKDLGAIDQSLFNHRLQQEPLKRLLDFGAIKPIQEKYELYMPKVAILYNFFNNSVLCYNYCFDLQQLIEEYLKSEDLELGNTLFSKPECDYLNYILNKSAFSDGLDLRNKYSHGTTSNDEEEHSRNYLEFLKIMVLIIIKINEEFTLKTDISE